MASDSKDISDRCRVCFIETLRDVEDKVSGDGKTSYPKFLDRRTTSVEVWRHADKEFNLTGMMVDRVNLNEWLVGVPYRNLECDCCGREREDGKKYCFECKDTVHVIRHVIQGRKCPYRDCTFKDDVEISRPIDNVPDEVLYGVASYMMNLSENEKLDLRAIEKSFSENYKFLYPDDGRKVTLMVDRRLGADWVTKDGLGDDEGPFLRLPRRRLV